jgi:methyl-accepting chemotaxis protein
MLNKIKLKTRLITLFMTVGIIPFAIISLIFADLASTALKEKSYNQLIAVREIKKSQIENFFKERINDAKVLADSPFIKKAFKDLDAALEDGGGPLSGNFKGHTNEKYDAPADYRKVHAAYFANLKFYMMQYGYYDLFLMSPDDGDISFSVTKEADFGIRTSSISSSLTDVWRLAAKEGKTAISDTKRYAPSNNLPSQFIAAPIKENGQIIGVVALQLSIQAVNQIMQQRDGMGKTGESYLVGEDKLMRSDSFLDQANHTVTASFANPGKGQVDTEAAREALSGKTDSKIIMDYNGNPVLSAFAPLKIGDSTWAIIAEIDEAEAFSSIRTLQTIILATAVALIVAILALAILISRSITRPILKCVEFAKSIADGDLTSQISDTSEDEIGILSKSINKMAESLRDQIREIGEGTSILAASASEILATVSQLSSSSAETATATHQTTATVDEVRQTSEVSNQKANIVSESSQASAQAAQDGMEHIHNVIKEMARIKEQMSIIADSTLKLSEQGQDITNIISTVGDLAEQSNLLAVNASIEAVKAGEHGKGFGVVALEIRRLAEQSKQSTFHVRTILNDVQKAVGKTVMATEQGEKVVIVGETLANQTGEVIRVLESNINESTQAAMHIAASSQQQLTGVNQVAEAMANIKTASSQNHDSAENLKESAQNLENLGKRLMQLVEHYQV